MISFTLLISGGRQRIEIEAIFRVSRLGEAERLKNCGVPGNHRLLWHGTKTANMIGILQQGLRIAPPEASRSGWSLGKVCVVTSGSSYTPNVAKHIAKHEEDCSYRFPLFFVVASSQLPHFCWLTIVFNAWIKMEWSCRKPVEVRIRPSFGFRGDWPSFLFCFDVVVGALKGCAFPGC